MTTAVAPPRWDLTPFFDELDDRRFGAAMEGIFAGVDRLVAKPCREELLVAVVRPHDLDRHLPLEHRVRSGPHVGHPAGRDALPQLVPVAEHEPGDQSIHCANTCRTSVEPRRVVS